jgi:hypothetical protein
MNVINKGTGGTNWLVNLNWQLILKVSSHLATLQAAFMVVKKLPGLKCVDANSCQAAFLC